MMMIVSARATDPRTQVSRQRWEDQASVDEEFFRMIARVFPGHVAVSLTNLPTSFGPTRIMRPSPPPTSVGSSGRCRSRARAPPKNGRMSSRR